MEKHPPPKNVTRRAKGHHPLCPDDFQTLAPLPSYRSEREKSNSLPSEHLLSMAKEPSSDAKDMKIASIGHSVTQESNPPPGRQTTPGSSVYRLAARDSGSISGQQFSRR